MISWIKRLFGEGFIYAEFICEDGVKGRSKAPYIGDPTTFDKDEYAQALREEVWFKRGVGIKEITSIRIV